MRARFSVWFSLRRRAEKTSRVAAERLETSRIERGERLLSRDEPHPRAFLRARLGQEERPGVEIHREEADLLRDGRASLFPLESAGDHEVKDEEQTFFEGQDEAFAQSGHREEAPALDVLDRRLHGAHNERAREPDLSQHFAPHEAVEVLQVEGHIRQLGHSRENIGR